MQGRWNEAEQLQVQVINMLCRIPWQIFSVILHLFPSILCYSPMLFYPLLSSRHIPSHSVIPSHSIFCLFFHLYPFILSHPFIFPYWDLTVSSSDLNLYSGFILVSATTPIILTPSCSDLLLYSYFYCSMICSILIVCSVYILTSCSS